MNLLRVCFFIVLVVFGFACQKEGRDAAPSPDGKYFVTGTEGQHTGSGLVTISGNTMDISIPGVLSRSGVKFALTGTVIGYPLQEWGGYDNWRIIGGNGTLTADQINTTIRIMRWENELYVVHVTGSK